MEHVRRAFDAVIDDVNKDDMSVVCRINTSGRDRYNTVIAAHGGRFKNFRSAGAPVLWEHGKHPQRWTDPIANSPKLWNNGGPVATEIIAQPTFLSDDFSRQRFEWYRDGKVKGWSVNILPTMSQCGPPTKDELRSRPDWEGVETVFRDWDLAEFSGTVIPGNADAVTSDRAVEVLEMVQRGIMWIPEEAKEIFQAISVKAVEPAKEPEPEPEPEKPKRTVRYIDTDGSRWTLCEPDESIIATFTDPEDAEECLRAMSQSRSFERILMSVHTEQQAKFESQKEDLLAEILLRQWGVV